MSRSHVVCGVLLSCLAVPIETSAAGWKPEVMERSEEIAEALAAGPRAIRAEAGLYVLTVGGYELVRESGNGFHCLVGRSQPDAYEPQCFDAEGSATLLLVTLERGALLMRGASRKEIVEAIAAGWETGRFHAPTRPGINYMLSEKNRVPVSPDQVISYGPHLMFYAPNLTDADIGGDRTGKASPVFMINEGQPSGYVIVPVPSRQNGAD